MNVKTGGNRCCSRILEPADGSTQICQLTLIGQRLLHDHSRVPAERSSARDRQTAKHRRLVQDDGCSIRNLDGVSEAYRNWDRHLEIIEFSKLNRDQVQAQGSVFSGSQICQRLIERCDDTEWSRDGTPTCQHCFHCTNTVR